MMKRCLLIFLCVHSGEALRLASVDLHANKTLTYPQVKAGCGAMYVGGGADEYVLKEMKIAQRVASLKMPEGWCAQDPTLTHVPVVYFHDRKELTSERIKERLQADGAGDKPLFEAFYIGSAEQPIMDGFQPIPKMFPTYYKWFRPQLFQISPFKTTISLDGDAVVCTGEKLAQAVKFFQDSKKSVAAPKHLSGLNMGFVIFDTETAKPWAAAWAKQIEHCIETKGEVTHDQNAMQAVMRKGFSYAGFNPHNICRRDVKTEGCATPSCWVDHRPGHRKGEPETIEAVIDSDSSSCRSCSSC